MSKVIINIFWATASSWIQQTLTFVTVLFVARLVSPSAFGVVAVALLFVLLFQRILLESIGYIIVREDTASCNKSFLDSAHFLVISLSIILTSMIFVLSDFLASLFEMPNLGSVLRVLSIIPVFDGICMVQTSLFRRNMQFKFITLRTALVNFFSGVAGIGLAFAGYDIWALVWQQVTGSFTGCIVLWFSSAWRPGKNISFPLVKSLLLRSLPMMANAIVFVMTNRIDIMMLGLFSSATSTGVYTIAKRITRTITDSFVTGVNSVSLTVFSGLKGNSVLLAESYFKNLRYVSILLYPCFVGLIVTADLIVPMLLGNKWMMAVPSVRILGVAGLIQIVSLFLNNVMIALNHTKKIFFINATSFIFLTLTLFAMVVYGAAGVAFAFVVQTFLIILMQLTSLHLAGMNLFVVSYKAIFAPVVCSVFMGGIVYFAKASVGQLNQWISFLFISLVGFVIYLLLMFIFMRCDALALLNKLNLKKGKI